VVEETDVPFARDEGRVRDAYAVLGLPRRATEADVRAAWREAARRTHPDVGGDPVAFREARAAYEILIDPVQRAAHDRLLDARNAAPSAHPAQHVTPSPPPRGPERSGAGRGGNRRTSPDAPRPSASWDPRWRWVLLAANVVVLLRAIALLGGGGVSPPRASRFDYPLPADGVALWVASIDLLGLPWLFLALSAAAVALLVAELVHERSGGAPLLGAVPVSVARFVQTALPAPLAVGVALTAAALLVQLLITLMIFAVFLLGIWLVLVVLTD
jgi:hypothetical protein